MRALLSFFTVLPLGSYPLEAAARRAYLLPLVGLISGAPAALVLISGTLPDALAAIFALALCLLAAGLHHADGVLDVGDALMVRGDPRRRREVLVDARVGIGGLFALFLVYAPPVAALAELAARPLLAASALLASEVAARSTMLLLMAFGSPATEHSSAVPFVKALRGPRRVVGIALALLIPTLILLPFGPLSALPLILLPLLTAGLLSVCRQVFGGITGDVIGASGEAARTILLVILSVTI
jgi:adenosylcobinamide-GDP ribazoletransferase